MLYSATLKKEMKACVEFVGLQLQAKVINPPVRELVSDRPRPLADKSTRPCPDWGDAPPWASLPLRVIFPALSLVGWSSASGHERAKWNTNAPKFPIRNFHNSFPHISLRAHCGIWRRGRESKCTCCVKRGVWSTAQWLEPNVKL